MNNLYPYYKQAVSDIERQWTLGTKEQLRHLATLQQRGSKREVRILLFIILQNVFAK